MLVCEIIVQAKVEDVITSIQEIAFKQEIESDELTARIEISEILDHYDLELVPDITTGDFFLKRTLRKKEIDHSFIRIEKDINTGEDEFIEFKSSLFFDRRRFNSGKFKKSDCYSDDVLHSALKSIAAFLNTKGGRLYIGVDDTGKSCGIEDDFECKKSVSNADKLELFLRDKIRSLFYQGEKINSYVKIQFTQLSGHTVLIAEISAAPFLSFLKQPKQDFSLFLRRGNSTKRVNINEIEFYFDITRKF